MAWTRFWDMNSGGYRKLDWTYIYIEAPMDEAIAIFKKRFGRDPLTVTCDCCGSDYDISEYEDLEQATGYHRGCEKTDKGYVERPVPHQMYRARYKYMPLDEYILSNSDDVLVIYAEETAP